MKKVYIANYNKIKKIDFFCNLQYSNLLIRSNFLTHINTLGTIEV